VRSQRAVRAEHSLEETTPAHGLSSEVISLYAQGTSIGDIEPHLAEVDGIEISRDTIP
jgi:hypothetical protein